MSKGRKTHAIGVETAAVVMDLEANRAGLETQTHTNGGRISVPNSVADRFPCDEYKRAVDRVG